MRTCPFHNCVEDLPDHIFACRQHWFSLGKSERSTIYAAYESYMRDEIDIEELRRRQQAVLGTRGTA